LKTGRIIPDCLLLASQQVKAKIFLALATLMILQTKPIFVNQQKTGQKTGIFRY